MKLLWIPCWYDFAGGEAYNVILEKENGEFNKNKVSMEFEFDESTKYVISVENGVLSLRKEELAKRKKEWLSSSSYEVEIKGWEW